jgi:proline iminopeptidase
MTGLHKDYDLTNRLGELSVPTLFISGRYGSSRPEETGLYHSFVRGAELEVFENSSHLPHLEEPDKYLQVVRSFMHRVEHMH